MKTEDTVNITSNITIEDRRLGVGYSIPQLSVFLEEKAFTYILRCSDNSLYCGWSNDVEKRLKLHNSGRGAKYTCARLPVKLVYFEVYENKVYAMKREYEIKQMSKAEKEKLIYDAENSI